MNLSLETVGNILFLDIETVSQHSDFDEMDERGQTLFSKKVRYQISDEKTPEILYKEKAAIFAEFGKIICISVGIVFGEDRKVKLKTFRGEEKDLLLAFKELLDVHYNNPEIYGICGHNLKEFDIPYICRRMIINGIDIPEILKISGKKPWQVAHLLDTMEMWKFGDYKNYISLDLMTYALDIPTPKTDIDGSQVGKVFYGEEDTNIIYKYCEQDVIQVVMKHLRQPIITLEDVTFTEW